MQIKFVATVETHHFHWHWRIFYQEDLIYENGDVCLHLQASELMLQYNNQITLLHTLQTPNKSELHVLWCTMFVSIHAEEWHWFMLMYTNQDHSSNQ